jgi:hypothetical protein
MINEIERIGWTRNLSVETEDGWDLFVHKGASWCEGAKEGAGEWEGEYQAKLSPGEEEL